MAKRPAIRRKSADRAPEAGKPARWPLVERPGFLVRRLHQIHVSLFMDACADFKITPLQYTVLSILEANGPMDQTTLATAAALDRTTTTDIVKRLHARGLTQRTVSREDRRAQLCSLTSAGTALLAQMEMAARQAHRKTLEPLTGKERATLVKLLARAVAAHESSTEQDIMEPIAPRHRDASRHSRTR